MKSTFHHVGCSSAGGFLNWSPVDSLTCVTCTDIVLYIFRHVLAPIKPTAHFFNGLVTTKCPPILRSASYHTEIRTCFGRMTSFQDPKLLFRCLYAQSSRSFHRCWAQFAVVASRVDLRWWIRIELSFSHEKVRRKFLFIFRQPVLAGKNCTLRHIILHLSPRITRPNVCNRARTMRACFTAEGVHLSVGGSIRPKDKLT